MSEGNDRKLRDNDAAIDAIKRDIHASNEARKTIDEAISGLQDELSRSTSLRTNISANVRYRNEKKEIEKVETEMEGIDIEQAARSRREFNKRYTAMMDKETETQNKVGRISVEGPAKQLTPWWL